MPIDTTDPLLSAILTSPTYRLAYEDEQFLTSDAMRGARLQLELMRPEEYLRKHNVNSTVVVFGSARIAAPDTAKAALDLLRAQTPANPTAASAPRPPAAILIFPAARSM